MTRNASFAATSIDSIQESNPRCHLFIEPVPVPALGLSITAISRLYGLAWE